MPWKAIDPAAAARERQRRKAMEAARPRDHNRPYLRASWRQARRDKLVAQPVCEFCRDAPATEVDHINGDPWDNQPQNLRSTCKPCHSARTMRDQINPLRARRAGRRTPPDARKLPDAD
jgi:5-methylcytosine-specific restriction protein A